VKEIVVLRHGEKEGDSLTRQGIADCKALVARIGSFDLAIASPRHRAIQTAKLVAGLDVIVDERAGVPEFPDSELSKLAKIQQTHKLGIIGAIWESPSLIEDARTAGAKLKDLVREVMNELLSSQRALIVSHDGTMIGLEKLLRTESFDTIDHSFGPLEGISINEQFKVRSFK
jgi:broad specificity phosphatase PhoE